MCLMAIKLKGESLICSMVSKQLVEGVKIAKSWAVQRCIAHIKTSAISMYLEAVLLQTVVLSCQMESIFFSKCVINEGY